MMGSSDDKQITIRGLIVPSEWDDRGNVISISVSSFNEDEYLIEEDNVSEKIHNHIRETVEASGFVREEGGVKRIKIKSFRVKKLPPFS